MQGLLVVNHFLKSEKFDEIHRRLCDAAKKFGINLIQYTNAEAIAALLKIPGWFIDGKDKPDFVLFWDKDIRLAKLIESYGIRVFNASDAIDCCDDKAKTYTALRKYKIRMPETVIMPMSYSPVDWGNLVCLTQIQDLFCFPVILKECYGSFGEQVHLAHTYDELIARMETIGNRPMMVQEFISSSKGRDIRLNVVGDRVVASMYRYAVNGDFRANVTNGGKMKPYEPTNEQMALAVSVCGLLGLDFGGVDILFGDDGTPVLCEVNSNAHFKSIYDCTGINVADHMIAYIKGVIYG